MSYEQFRHFADSWGLLFMAFAWLVLVLWAFRPGSKHHNDRAARMILDESESDD